MAKLMTSINQIEGGDILKSGDVTSVFGFEILGYDGKRMNLSGTGKLTLSNDENVALYQRRLPLKMGYSHSRWAVW